VLWAASLCAESPSSSGYPGGIADAQWPSISNNINDYQSSFRNPIIMNGILYYNAPTTQQTAKYGYYAVDLYTGNQIWYKNGTDNGLDNPYSITTTQPRIHCPFIRATILRAVLRSTIPLQLS
jgi:hypothetical protein